MYILYTLDVQHINIKISSFFNAFLLLFTFVITFIRKLQYTNVIYRFTNVIFTILNKKKEIKKEKRQIL